MRYRAFHQFDYTLDKKVGKRKYLPCMAYFFAWELSRSRVIIRRKPERMLKDRRINYYWSLHYESQCSLPSATCIALCELIELENRIVANLEEV